MKAILKSFNLSDKAIKIYLEGIGKRPYTSDEIQNIIPNIAKNELNDILEELIEKKLILLVKPKYSEHVPHYVFIPPFSAILNSITEINKESELQDEKKSEDNYGIERFQEIIYKDIENISEELVDKISSQEISSQTTLILSEVEENVKKFSQIILNDVIELISPLKMQSALDNRHIIELIRSVKQKITESKEIVSSMFSQFRDIIKEKGTSDLSDQVEAFKRFIRNLGESIDKRVQELSSGVGNLSIEKINTIEQSLYDFLAEYVRINKMITEKIWSVNSLEKIKQIISILLDKCSKNLTIIVPNIEEFVPLDKFDLDSSNELSLEQIAHKKEVKPEKNKPTSLSITKKQKQEIEDKLNIVAKKVGELKGFEISHDIAEILALISEVNPQSPIIETVQGWLNRLLVIRKHLDPNTQYLLLENIDKWKKEYLNITIKKMEPDDELLIDLKNKISEKDLSTELGLKVQIISSEPHSNKQVIAIRNVADIEYLELKNNNIFAAIGDDSYLILGVYHKFSKEPKFEISGLFTTYKPLIEIICPLIIEIISKASYPKEIEINKGFNDIIENINDYTGKKISKKLKRLLDVAFKEDGLSLETLELKLLIGKLEKLYQPLDDQMKEYLINELNKLNKILSTLELNYPPEFRHLISEEVKDYSRSELVPLEVEPLDPDRLNNLFDLLIENVDNLKGVEIGNQIDKVIEQLLEIQGYANILEWKTTLSKIEDTLEEPFKEKIKEDLLKWKIGLLNQIQTTPMRLEEESTYIVEDSPQELSTQDTPASIIKEEYISPSLVQSQFKEEEILSDDDAEIVDPREEMRYLFNKIQTQLEELTGTEISKILQNIVDIILETEGYSMALKSVKDWISKFRIIRSPLEKEMKEDFELEFFKWKEKYSFEEEETSFDFS